MEEIWKKIKGFNNYKVSNFGRLISIKTNKILKPTDNGRGYLRFSLLGDDNNNHTVYLHRIIAEAFIPNPDNKPCIDHINTNKQDNRIENIRWVTYKENTNNELTIERVRNSGKKNKKKICSIDEDGNKVVYSSAREAQRKLNILCTAIGNCLHGRSKTCHGLRWMYVS